MLATNSTSGAYCKIRDSAARFVARHRLPLATLCCGAALVWIDQHSTAAAVIGLLFLACTLLHGRRYFLVVLALSLIAAGLHQLRLHHEATLQAEVAERRLIDVQGLLLSAPEATRRGWTAQLRVETSTMPALVHQKIMIFGHGSTPEIGKRLTASGKLEPIPGPRNEGEFDRADWMRRSGFVADFLVSDIAIDPRPADSLLRRTESTRVAFRHAITQGLPAEDDAAKVIRAMVLGEQPPYNDPLLQPFRNSGTLHLFSVSGQHVNLVAILLWLLLRFLRVPRRAAITLLIPAIFGYAWMTGASAPAIRAAWMAAVFLSAFYFQRKPHLMNALAIVMTAAMFWNGHLLFLAGVQLSYGVVAAISIGLSLSARRIHALTLQDSYLPRDLYHAWQIRTDAWWRSMWQALCISTAACIGSAPLTMKHFGMITPISIIANIALTPLVALLLGLSLLSAALAPISSTASCFCNRLNAHVARGCIIVSDTFAKLPGSHAAVSWHRPDQDGIRIFDIPRGGAAVLVQSRQADVLLDTADKRNFEKIVMPCLRYFGAKPDSLWLSHPESAHLGGSSIAIQHFPIKQIIAPVARARSSSFRTMLSQATTQHLPVYVAQSGKQLAISDDISWEILSHPEPNDHYSSADDRVAIYLLHFHGYRLLFLNDSGPAAWNQLVKHHPNLQCDVVVCGRHRLYAPIDSGFLKQWKTRAVVATHAEFPIEEALDPAWQNHLRDNNITLFHQGQTGMVHITLDEHGALHLSAWLNHQEIRLSPREPTLAIPE